MGFSSQFLFLGTILPVIYLSNSSADSVTNILRGLAGILFCLVAQSFLKHYDAPFVQGHTRFWQVLHRLCLCYMAFLVFVLFQEPSDMRRWLGYVRDSYGHEMAARTEYYDVDCDINQFKARIDHYTAAHFFLWFFAAFLLRDTLILHIWSVLDEVIELSTEHIRPNFAECWWDHLFMDLLFTNTTGIILGMYVLRLFKIQEFDWLGRKGNASSSIKKWRFWYDSRHFITPILVMIFVTCNFVCNFTMSNSLWIPANDFPFNTGRVLLWMFAGILGFSEAYTDIQSWGTPERVYQEEWHQYRWTAWFMLLMEMCITVKYRHQAGNVLDSVTPLWVWCLWGSITFLVLVYYLWLKFCYRYRIDKFGRYWNKELRRQTEAQAKESASSDNRRGGKGKKAKQR